MESAPLDAAVLFIQYLEGRMSEPNNIEERLAALPKPGCPEVGEDGAPQTCLLFRNGRTSVINASSCDLERMELTAYPYADLTTQHALVITRALATLHAHAAGAEAVRQGDSNLNANVEVCDLVLSSKCPTAMFAEERECLMAKVEQCNGECGDLLTAEITQTPVAKANLTILTERIADIQEFPNVVRQLKNLDSDLSTLIEFIKFSSAVSKKWVASIGPICVSDVWIKQDDGDDVIGIRLRGGKSLRAPPLRDAAWVWLTLIEPATLRQRYSELCDEYCNAFNSAYHRMTAQPGQPVREVISYFDVMRDLGECFLHAFFTVLHKFVLSGTWALDRGTFDRQGVVRLASIIEFLIENGIVGNIFIA